MWFLAPASAIHFKLKLGYYQYCCMCLSANTCVLRLVYEYEGKYFRSRFSLLPCFEAGLLLFLPYCLLRVSWPGSSKDIFLSPSPISWWSTGITHGFTTSCLFMWISGTELRLTGLCGKLFVYRALLQDLQQSFEEQTRNSSATPSPFSFSFWILLLNPSQLQARN